jgi:hypothetical protein
MLCSTSRVGVAPGAVPRPRRRRGWLRRALHHSLLPPALWSLRGGFRGATAGAGAFGPHSAISTQPVTACKGRANRSFHSGQYSFSRNSLAAVRLFTCARRNRGNNGDRARPRFRLSIPDHFLASTCSRGRARIRSDCSRLNDRAAVLSPSVNCFGWKFSLMIPLAEWLPAPNTR